MRSSIRLSRRLQRDLLLRTTLLWCGVRVMVSGLAAYSGSSPLTIGYSASVSILVGVALLFDVRVCRETLLLENLGVSRAQILAVGLAVSCVAETAMQTFASLV